MYASTFLDLLAISFLLPATLALPTANPLPPRSATTWSLALFTSPVCSFEDPTKYPYKTYSGSSRPTAKDEDPKCWKDDIQAGVYRPIQLPGTCEVTFYNDDACKQGTESSDTEAGFLTTGTLAEGECWKPWQPFKTFKVICT